MTQLEQAILNAAKAFVATYGEAKPQPSNVTPIKEASKAAVSNGVGSHCGKQLRTTKPEWCEDGYTGFYWCGECKAKFNKDLTPTPKKSRA